jgi:hypothetical protein
VTVPAGPAASGVRGRLMVDEGGPVVRENSPWPARPLQGRVLALPVGRGSGPVAEVDSDADGYFQLELAPGDYEIRSRNLTGAPVPRARPVMVHVMAGTFTDITIHFDSGIR